MDAEKIDEPHQKSGGNSRSKRPRASYTGLAPTPVFHNLTADLPCRWANCQDICPDLCAYYTHLRYLLLITYGSKFELKYEIHPHN